MVGLRKTKLLTKRTPSNLNKVISKLEQVNKLHSLSKIQMKGNYFYESNLSRNTMKQVLYKPDVSGQEAWEKQSENDMSPRITTRIFMNSYYGKSSQSSLPHENNVRNGNFNSPSQTQKLEHFGTYEDK